MTAHTHNLAILFADIADSTHMYEVLGDRIALQRIDQALTIMKRIAQKFGGKTVKTIGDEILCVFPSADAALQAASEMQAAAANEPLRDNLRLAMRIAFHYGEAIEEDGDVFGDTVNVAARLAALAKAEQILTSQQAVDALSPFLRLGIRKVETLPLKGKQEEVEVCEVIWQFGEDLTMMEGRAPGPSKETAKLTLRLGSRTWALEDGRAALTIGRDAHNDIPIASKMASRQHARIEHRRDKFVLVDVSTNGTFVTFDGAEEVLVKREELRLHGTGTLSFGQSAIHHPEAEILRFSCE